MSYEMIKRNFDRGLWTASMVVIAVKKGVITPEQYQTITTQPYKEV